jgi:hypothetical protein
MHLLYLPVGFLLLHQPVSLLLLFFLDSQLPKRVLHTFFYLSLIFDHHRIQDDHNFAEAYAHFKFFDQIVVFFLNVFYLLAEFFLVLDEILHFSLQSLHLSIFEFLFGNVQTSLDLLYVFLLFFVLLADVVQAAFRVVP